MTTQNRHQDAIKRQFGNQADAYLTSAVHAQGEDLHCLRAWLPDSAPNTTLLDLGCGAGHVSFTVAEKVAQVVAYDLSEKMLGVVQKVATEKGLTNIRSAAGAAESLPFADASFDWVASRYSAHHWHDVGQALREVRRVLKPGGQALIIDVVSPGNPLLDIYLQTVEVLRDTSHVRNYAPGEWLSMLTAAGFIAQTLRARRLLLEFDSWVARMRTPEVFIHAIRALQQQMSDEVRQHFAIQDDGTFTSDIMTFVVTKPVV